MLKTDRRNTEGGDAGRNEKKKKIKGKKTFQTHIYDLELNCLSLCNSPELFYCRLGRTKCTWCYSTVRLVSHPPIRFKAEVSGAFSESGTPWKLDVGDFGAPRLLTTQLLAADCRLPQSKNMSFCTFSLKTGHIFKEDNEKNLTFLV